MQRIKWAFEHQGDRINSGVVRFAMVRGARKPRRLFSGNYVQRVIKAWRAYPAFQQAMRS